LAGFVDEGGLVCVYEKGKPGGFRAAPHNTGLEKDFYTVETHEKPRDSAIVEKLMGTVDDLAAPILRKLLCQEPIAPQERADFAYFIAFMYLRVPAFREISQQVAMQLREHGLWDAVHEGKGYVPGNSSASGGPGEHSTTTRLSQAA
jgi:hypothetical protein